MTATFPGLTPSSRAFGSGKFPVKAFQSQNGAEVRLLYGDRRTGMSLSLTYDNIADSQAQLFLDHYHEVKGTFYSFPLGSGTTSGQLEGAKAGWAGEADAIGAGIYGSEFRYAEPPQLQSVYPGVSSVTVKLIGATV